jgi:inorganic triphosphatase YgiF
MLEFGPAENRMAEDDLDRPVTRRDVIAILDEREVATRRDLLRLRDEVKADLSSVREELRIHFNVVAEQFKDEFKNLFDWTEATTSTIGAGVALM